VIPKKIHYCWMSGERIPGNLQAYIDEWHKLLPDYEIKLWSCENFDVAEVPFVHEAYKAKKWAFVADYIRMYALYTEGGIYLDSDVKVLKRFDSFLRDDFFTSIESTPLQDPGDSVGCYVNSDFQRLEGVRRVPFIGFQAAIVGSVAGHPFVGSVLEHYRHATFVNDLEVLKENIAPSVQAIHAEPYGFRYVDELQRLRDGMVIYPSNVFASFNTFDKSSVAVHLCAGGWIPKNRRERVWNALRTNWIVRKVYTAMRKMFGR